MSRLEKFRESRRTKRKYVFAFFLFFLLILPGICIADFSVNQVMKNRQQVELFTCKLLNGSYLEINLLEKKFYINVQYINRDLQNLRKKLSKPISMEKQP